ncbi:MAG: AI-2E family transporter [Clostridia bacterium]|nr:AI-2E family transporter [Clostridia bacterium]
MKHKEKIKQWLWYFSFPAAAVLLYKLYDNFGEALGLIGKLIDVLSPFVGGFVLAFLLLGPSRWLEERFLRLNGKAWPKLARPLALFILYVVFLGALTAVISLLIPVLISSLTDLVNAMPEYLRAAQEKLQAWFAADGPLGMLHLQNPINNVYNYLIQAATRMVTTENVLTAIKSVGNVASSLINVVISFVVSIYMLAGREHLCRALRNFMSLFIRPRTLARLRHYTRRTGHIFSQYIYGALLDALVVGVVVSIGLLIFRVPYAVLLGMILGVMNLVPYFGAIVGGVGISFVALLTNGLPTAIGVAVYIVVSQQVDANIIQPRIIGDSVGLRPFYVLLGITLFGGLFGFWGILLGPPLMAVVQMAVREIYAHRAKKKEKAAEDAARA